MKEAGALLARGEGVIVFPEGTRSKGDAMGEFKHGAFKMAFAAGAPVVPVVIDGSYKIMEANHNLMCPGHVTMTVLPPIETAGLDRAAQKALPDEPGALPRTRIKPQRTDAAQRRMHKSVRAGPPRHI